MSAQIDTPKYTYLKRGVYYFVRRIPSDLQKLLHMLACVAVTQVCYGSSPILETTSDYVESQSTTIFLDTNDPLFQAAQSYYGAWPSKWYQPDLNGDGLKDLVVFGVRKPSNERENWETDFDMCGTRECADWETRPFFAIASTSSGEYKFLEPNQEGIFDKNVIARTSGGKTIFADFNGDGRDDFYVPTWGLGANKGSRDGLWISTANGYEDRAESLERMRVRSLRHWASAGDIDNDGDIDIIAGDLGADNGRGGAKLDCFFNDGNANFSFQKCVKVSGWGSKSKHSWGGTLLDYNGDGFLDLWISFTGKKPAILLGDGSGQFSSDNKVEIPFPNSWDSNKRQIGYVLAADIEDDGYSDVFFSVQGTPGCGYGAYCGSDVGYFKNTKNGLVFGGFLRRIKKDEGLVWAKASQIAVKDLNGDGLKDVYLKRAYDQNALFLQTTDGQFVATPSIASLNLTKASFDSSQMVGSSAHKWTSPDGSTSTQKLCELAVAGKGWNTDLPAWVDAAKGRGLSVEMCLKFVGDRSVSSPDEPSKITILNNSSDFPDLDLTAPAKDISYIELCRKATFNGAWSNFAPKWRDTAKTKGISLDRCLEFAGREIQRPKNQDGGDTAQVSKTAEPDGTLPTKEICGKALSGDEWNLDLPKWVNEAKRRGLSAEMCKVFTQ